MKNKSWRTTSLGLLCWLFDYFLIKADAAEHFGPWRWNVGTLEQLAVPFALFVIGWALIHARDHKAQ